MSKDVNTTADSLYVDYLMKKFERNCASLYTKKLFLKVHRCMVCIYKQDQTKLRAATAA